MEERLKEYLKLEMESKILKINLTKLEFKLFRRQMMERIMKSNNKNSSKFSLKNLTKISANFKKWLIPSQN
jgi:predicted AAA+ superfamily ATPase